MCQEQESRYRVRAIEFVEFDHTQKDLFDATFFKNKGTKDLEESHWEIFSKMELMEAKNSQIVEGLIRSARLLTDRDPKEKITVDEAAVGIAVFTFMKRLVMMSQSGVIGLTEIQKEDDQEGTH